MIPVLHRADSVSWESFGLGALADAVSCKVLEERNGEYELELTYPISGQHFSDLALREIILAKPNFADDPQPFRIYKISKPLNGIVTVNAQHLSYDLSGYVDSEFSAVGIQAALIALTTNSTPAACPFTFSSDISDGTGKLNVVKPTSIRALMGGSDTSILKHWHGEWSYDGFECALNANRGTDRGVTIRYGKNLTSLKQDENNASVCTGIYPYWHNQDTNVTVTLPEKTINAPGTYDFVKITPVDLSEQFEEAPTETQLRIAAEDYIEDHDIGVPDINLTLSFVQLEEIRERVDLCDTVHVFFDALGVNAAAKCVRTEWDVLADRYSKIELGTIRTSIAGTIASIRETATQARAATSTLADTARYVSGKITGNMGGYVVMNDTDNDGEPDEILIMDSPSIETAVNIIRLNNGGIAFSQDGYHGEYGTAWNIEGEFVADYITSGTLQANLIRILGTTNFYWDAGNIYIINPNDSGQQIRIGQYDGTHYGIGFTRDSGVTWQTALDFQGLNIQATGFSKVYISMTPPDPSDYGLTTFNVGDIWVESERRFSWNEVKENAWAWTATHTWNYFGGETDPNMYTWNGGTWQKIYDGESFTSFETRLTVAENEIHAAVESVASKGTTYIQLTDPRNDPGITINMGDHWIKAEPGYSVISWNKAATMAWNQVAGYDWNSMDGPKEYAWDGYEWVLVSDHGAEVRHSTAIIENDKQIKLLATAQATMNNQLIENTASINVQANQITSEVQQRKAGEVEMSSRITQTAQQITAEVQRATGAEGSLSSRITQEADRITSEVERASAAEGTLSSRITQEADRITSEVERAGGAEDALSSRITQTADSITSEVERATGAEGTLSSRITQTEDSITSEVTRATEAEGTLSSRITQTEDSITTEVTRATEAEGDLSSRITQTEDSITSEVTRATEAEGTLSSTITQEVGRIDLAVRGKYDIKSGITITDNGVDVSGSKHINLDVNAQNYVHLDSNGIEMRGSKVNFVDNDGSTYSAFGRDDIKILKRNDNEQAIINDMVNRGKHDWVLIKPYYDATVDYMYSTQYGVRNSPPIVPFARTSNTSFADSGSSYSYTISGVATSLSAGVFALNCDVRMSNDPDMRTYHTMQLRDIQLGGVTGNFSYTGYYSAGANLCGEGKVLYVQIVAVNYSYDLSNLKMHCTTDSATSKVPCTVYYFP